MKLRWNGWRRVGYVVLAAGAVAVAAAGCAGGGTSSVGSPTPPVSRFAAQGPPALGTDATSPDQLDETLGAMGRSSIAWNVSYLMLDHALDTPLLDAEAARGVQHHVVTLEFWNGQSGPSLRAIAQGEADSWLAQVAQGLAAWHQQHPEGGELVVRPLHEANGDWYPWGFKGGHNGNGQADFGPAWNDIRQVMRATMPDLAFLWCPNGGDSTYASWYPGTTNTEYVGEDRYNRSQAEGYWRTPAEVHNATLSALRSAAPDKPLVIAETGGSDPSRSAAAAGHSKAEWFGLLGDWMRQDAARFGVVAVCYFDHNKEGSATASGPGNDWRIYPVGKPGAEVTREAFRKATHDLK